MRKSAIILRIFRRLVLINLIDVTVAFVHSSSSLPRNYIAERILPRGLYQAVVPLGMHVIPSNPIVSSVTSACKALDLVEGTADVVKAAGSATLGIDTYWLTRIVLLRSLGFVYCAAFLVAYFQNRALIGDSGIAPARVKLDDAERNGAFFREREKEWRGKYKKGSEALAFSVLRTLLNIIPFVDGDKYANGIYEWWTNKDRAGRPLVTLLWFVKDRKNLNECLDCIALAGLAMAMFLLLHGSGNVPLIFMLWLCQHSLMSVGGPFYGFGWEPQLAELTFHVLFMVPFWSLQRVPLQSPVPKLVVWAIRWHLFRIMIGAGLIKMRSRDKKWKNLTTMDYFYETQPVPNVLTRFFHRMPKSWHKFEVLTNHFVELVAPWLLIIPFLPRGLRIVGGLIQLIFQLVLIFSGNLSFLNWLTIVPSIICFDDAFLVKSFLPGFTSSSLVAASTKASGWSFRRLITVLFGVAVTKLSIPVVKNLCSKNQLMNGSFDPLRLINTYGAFGTVSEERVELVVSSAETVSGPWKEYNFKVKPVDVMKKPRWITPYHYRLDWQFWIAQFSYEPPAWMYNFLLKLLREDPDVMALLDGNPWSKVPVSEDECNNEEYSSLSSNNNVINDRHQGNPKYIQIEKYIYRFSDPGRDDEENGTISFWQRKRVGRYFPRQGVVSEDDLNEIVARSGIEG